MRGHHSVALLDFYRHLTILCICMAMDRCVEARNAESGGLRDGDECEKEGEAYRECRKKLKEFRQSQEASNNKQ